MSDINPNDLTFRVVSSEVRLPESESDRIVFEISGEHYQKYTRWKYEIEKKINQRELETGSRTLDGEPLTKHQIQQIEDRLSQGKSEVYYGVIEDGYIFSFYPTQLGNVVTVKNVMTGEEINLTDYECW